MLRTRGGDGVGDVFGQPADLAQAEADRGLILAGTRLGATRRSRQDPIAPECAPARGRIDQRVVPVAVHHVDRQELHALPRAPAPPRVRSEEHTSELQSLMRSSYAVFCLKNK